MRLISIFEKSYELDYSLSLKLNEYWKDVILVPDLVKLFFHVRICSYICKKYFFVNFVVGRDNYCSFPFSCTGKFEVTRI